MTLQAPETLGQDLSALSSGQVRTGGHGDLSGLSAALQSGQVRTPRSANPWLDQKIAISRRQAKPTTCTKCGADTLTGDDHDHVAAVTTIDPTPISQLDEVVAILTNQPTYNLVRGAIHHREYWNAGRTSATPIHLAHRCSA